MKCRICLCVLQILLQQAVENHLTAKLSYKSMVQKYINNTDQVQFVFNWPIYPQVV